MSSTLTLKATNLDFADLCHWHQRAKELLGHPVTIDIRPDPITFNRDDWTGENGTIRPVNDDTFTIDGIDGVWTMEDVDGLINMDDGEGRNYMGYWHNLAFFSVCGCEREDADPRIAFAQVMHNI